MTRHSQSFNSIVTTTEYARADMPVLRDLLDILQHNEQVEHVKILSGTPRCYYGSRQIKPIHGRLRYKNRQEIFRSKNLNNKILDARVARVMRDPEHKSATIYVFMPYGRYKTRPPSPNQKDETVTWSAWSHPVIKAPPGHCNPEDELPF